MFSQKYKKIILSISIFILLDLILFGLNYYSSNQFEINTKIINQTSELRMLSQQLTKSLLTLQNENKIGAPTQSSLSELHESSEHFDENIRFLTAQWVDAKVKSNSEDTAPLAAMQVQKINKEWRQWKEGLSPLLKETSPASEAIDFAVTKLNTKNVYMLALCDDLIQDIDLKASQQNSRTKLYSLIILMLAILIFLYIIYIFSKELSRSDNEIDFSNTQKNRILSAVNEGLLLIKPDGKIAAEMSSSVHRHLGRKIHSDMLFVDLFDEHLSDIEKTNLFKYLNLNLNISTSVNILKQLHPLKEIKLLINGHPKYLSFHFAQIIEHQRVAELLVTVTDVTDMVNLKSKLFMA
jgi:two-component system, chemotaxis family, sensor kinase CheA